MSKKKPLTPYEEAMRNVDRIIAELDAELARHKGGKADVHRR